ncbi:reverse transcriptase domain-containing protein [Tanacetum coccineum]
MERPQGVLSSNIVPNPREDIKVITTQSGVTLAGSSVFPPPLSSSKEVEREPKMTTDQILTESTTRVLPLAVQPSPASTSSELPPTPVYSTVKIYFNISFAEALSHMRKFAKMVKDLLSNKEKLFKLANTPLNENCSVVLLKKLPKKLGTTGRFLIPCDFYGLESCMALADLGIAEDVFIQVGKFTFPTDFVVVDYDVDPWVPLILGRPFLRMDHALVDVHGEELTLQVGDEKLVFNIESTSKTW